MSSSPIAILRNRHAQPLLTSRVNSATTGAVLYSDQGFAAGVLTGAIDASSILGRK
jgi:hypothetical protein